MITSCNMKILKVALLILTSVCALQLSAQLNTASPYSRFGFGELNTLGGIQTKTAGGVGIGTFDNSNLNTLNPAAIGFLNKPSMDLGFYFKNYTLENSSVSDKASTTGFNHFTYGFPLGNKKQFGLSAGVLPYSSVGYKFSSPYNDIDRDTTGNTSGTGEFLGSGGFNKAFLGGSYKIINKKDSTVLSVGVHLNYLFGTIQQESNYLLDNAVQFYNFSQTRRITARDFNTDFGLAFSFYPNKEKALKISFGAVLGLESNLKAHSEKYDYTYTVNSFGTASIKDTVQYELDKKGSIKTPQHYGFGASVLFKDVWQFGLDYYAQKWSSTPVDFQTQTTNAVNDRSRVSFTAQYLPESKLLFKQSLLKKTYYRLGAYSENTYYQVNGESISKFGTTFGIGVPVRRSGSNSRINLGVEYGVTGTTENNLIKESYTVFYLGITLQPSNIDRWFYKRKYD